MSILFQLFDLEQVTSSVLLYFFSLLCGVNSAAPCRGGRVATHEAFTVEPGAPSPWPVPFHPLVPELVYHLPSWPLGSILQGVPFCHSPYKMSGFPGPFLWFSPSSVFSPGGAVSRFSVLLVRSISYGLFFQGSRGPPDSTGPQPCCICL